MSARSSLLAFAALGVAGTFAAACGVDAVGGAALPAASADPSATTQPSLPSPSTDDTPPSSTDPDPASTTTPAPTGSTTQPPPDCKDGMLDLAAGDVVMIDPSTDFDLLGDFTVEAWIKPTAIGGQQILVTSHSNGAGGHAGWKLSLAEDRVYLTIYGSIPSTSTYADVAGNESASGYVQAGVWAHVAGVVSGNTAYVYYNGKLEDTQDLSDFQRAAAPAPVALGSDNATTDGPFVGLLDDVRISSTALYTGSTASVPSLPLTAGTTTVALYTFDETSGDTAADAMGKHEGTLGDQGQFVPQRSSQACSAK